ncbi:hypothetical protein BGX38DRAFT_1246815, partial [Terfezia claveryi]
MKMSSPISMLGDLLPQIPISATQAYNPHATPKSSPIPPGLSPTGRPLRMKIISSPGCRRVV